MDGRRRYCNAACQGRAWKGEAESFCYGMPHEGICPLLKQWRKMAKGKATKESAGLHQKMLEYLRAAVSASPGGRALPAPSAGGEEVWA